MIFSYSPRTAFAAAESVVELVRDLDAARRIWEPILGKSQPDELYMNVALAQTGIDPTLKNPYPVYFNYRQIDPEQDIVRDHYVLGLYGDHNFTHRTVVDYYDRKMNQILRTNFNMSIRHKANSLMKRKFTITRSA